MSSQNLDTAQKSSDEPIYETPRMLDTQLTRMPLVDILKFVIRNSYKGSLVHFDDDVENALQIRSDANRRSTNIDWSVGWVAGTLMDQYGILEVETAFRSIIRDAVEVDIEDENTIEYVEMKGVAL